ncbi:MAG TPA: hypothetical protein VFZ61_32340 [Polyangiales bacterium]
MTTLYMESVALASRIKTLQVQVMRRDVELGRRLRRGADELPEHLSEAMCLTGRARRHELEAARRGLRELSACLRAATGAGTLKERDVELESGVEQLLARLDEQMALKTA